MPPHIFSTSQQAYQQMVTSHNDQSIVVMGISGSGKTFSARYLLRYLATIGQSPNGPVTSELAHQLLIMTCGFVQNVVLQVS